MQSQYVVLFYKTLFGVEPPEATEELVEWRYIYDHRYGSFTTPSLGIPTAAFAWDATSNPPTVQFINQSIAATSSMWDFGDGNSSTEFSPSHTYAFSGDVETFTVCLTINGDPMLQVCHEVEVSNLLGGPTLSLWTLSTTELYNLTTEQLYNLKLIN